MGDIIALIRSFFFKEKVKLLNEYYGSSILGNVKSSQNKLKALYKFLLYEDYMISLYQKGVLSDELTKCFEACNVDLIKLRLFLEDLRGVNIDIIENEDPNESTLISY